MPFPMVHVAIAWELLNILHVEDPASYYLGVLAPDAYYSRPNRTFADRDASHLTPDDRARWRESVLRFVHDHKKDDRRCFHLGYGAHILTDILWEDRVYRPFCQAYAQRGGNPKDLRRAYVSDMTRVDLRLYRECTFKETVWSELKAAQCLDLAALVSAEEIDRERNKTLVWYDERKDAPIEPLAYVEYGRVLAFIRDAARSVGRDLVSDGEGMLT